MPQVPHNQGNADQSMVLHTLQKDSLATKRNFPRAHHYMMWSQLIFSRPRASIQTCTNILNYHRVWWMQVRRMGYRISSFTMLFFQHIRPPCLSGKVMETVTTFEVTQFSVCFHMICILQQTHVQTHLLNLRRIHVHFPMRLHHVY